MGNLEKKDETGRTERPKVPACSGDEGKTRSRRRKMKVLRIFLIFLAVFLVLGIILRFTLSGMLLTAANKKLPEYFTSAVKLKDVRLLLLDGRVTLGGLTVGQPPGYGQDLLLDLPEASIEVSLWSLLGSELTIDEINLTGFILHLVRDVDGNVNVAHLIRPSEEKTEAEGVTKPIYIRKITLKNATVQYTDSALGDESLDVAARQFEAVITDVYLNSARSHGQSLPGKLKATAQIVQPKFSAAPLGIVARFGYFYSDQPIPELNGAVRLAGVELQSLRAFVKQDKAQVIGGDIMDFNGDISMAPEVFDCILGIVTPSGSSLRMKIGGTPYQPLVDKSSFQGIIADRTGEAGLNALKNLPSTGEELGRTAVSSATTAGGVAGKMLMGIGTALFKTATSLSKGNMSEAGGNLEESASTTLPGNAKEMYDKTGASLSSGISKTGSAAAGIGSERARIWRDDTQRRWAGNWDEACKSVQQKPFPTPVHPGSAGK
ncbi:MAG: AsmA family protein [Victivallales bacterium]|jgi:hypothetical protein